jgi:hypothetical protein
VSLLDILMDKHMSEQGLDSRSGLVSDLDSEKKRERVEDVEIELEKNLVPIL